MFVILPIAYYRDCISSLSAAAGSYLICMVLNLLVIENGETEARMAAPPLQLFMYDKIVPSAESQTDSCSSCSTRMCLWIPKGQYHQYLQCSQASQMK